MLGPLVSALALASAKRSAERAARRMVMTAVAALMGLVAAGFVVAAIVIALTHAVGPIWACLIVAAFFAVVALVILLVRASSERRRALQSPGAFSLLGGLAAGSAAGSAAGEEAVDDALPRGRRRSAMGNLTSRKALLIPLAAFLAALFVARQ